MYDGFFTASLGNVLTFMGSSTPSKLPIWLTAEGMQLARFKPIYQTWRGKALEIKECVSKGQVLAYLDGGSSRIGKKVKKVLFDALTLASKFSAQRRLKFRPEQYRHRAAELTSYLALVRQIPSFKRMEEQLIPLLTALNPPVQEPPC